MNQNKPILELKKLKKYFPVRNGLKLKALEDVSLTMFEGEKFGVVGESGCGKSTLGRVILRLYNQTSGACIYHGKSMEEVAPKYIGKEIDKLLDYQKKAQEFYNESLKIDKKIQELEEKFNALTEQGSKAEEQAKHKLSGQIDQLQFKAKECRKDASRQLREGSRTVGSLILCENLPEIQQLFKKAHQATLNARMASKEYDKYDAAYGEALAKGNTQTAQIEKQLEEAGAKYVQYKNEALTYKAKALSMRGEKIMMITERCADEEYRKKLDSNYETGINMGKLTNKEQRSLRRDMQMIFQDPAASLDPRQSVGKAIEEVFRIHTDYGTQVRKEKTMELLESVGLKREHYYVYPHQLSGGQKQRVGIARAIALNPKFIVLDESVSALDVSVQAQILQLLNELRDKKGLTYFFITHNLGVVKHFCDRVMVMYLGGVCELSATKNLFEKPLHPYTQSLLAAVPRPTVKDQGMDETVLEGEVPSAVNPPKGCTFHTRCPKCMGICKQEKPVLKQIDNGHFVACHLY